jgi:hypothetical protein
MQAEQMKQFTKSLTTLAELYNKTLTANVIELYFGALSDLTLEEATEACKRAALSLKFFPMPVELRELIAGTKQDQADSAWYLLTQAVEKGAGQYSTFVENPALASAINRQFNGMIGAHRVLSGLDASDPMYASNRNAFRACFQFCADSAGGGKYYEGTNELSMRGLIWPQDRTDTVVVIGREVARLQMPFCRVTGELLPAAKQSLLTMNRRELAAFLPKARPVLAIAAASENEELVPMPDDVREALANFKGGLRLVPQVEAAEVAA